MSIAVDYQDQVFDSCYKRMSLCLLAVPIVTRLV